MDLQSRWNKNMKRKSNNTMTNQCAFVEHGFVVNKIQTSITKTVHKNRFGCVMLAYFKSNILHTVHWTFLVLLVAFWLSTCFIILQGNTHRMHNTIDQCIVWLYVLYANFVKFKCLDVNHSVEILACPMKQSVRLFGKWN